jgi:glycosyltransferase involved in cell wall biosynthesis
MTVRNAAQWLDETFQSLVEQMFENINIELSIYNDGSSASDLLFGDIGFCLLLIG